MFYANVILLLVSLITKPVLTCRLSPEPCRKETITVNKRLPIETYIKMYQESITKWSLPPTIVDVTIPDNKIIASKKCIGCGSVAVDIFDPILNGNIAPEKYYPWQVYVRGKYLMCGGVLISSLWVLTAAHCISDTQYVILGTTNIVKYSENMVSRSPELEIIHEHYREGQNDIALIKMIEPVVFNDYIRPACIPKEDADFKSSECHVTGWGLTNHTTQTVPEYLQVIKVTVMTHWDCFLRWSFTTIKINEGHICTHLKEGNYNSGPCSGDSGGPLSCYYNNTHYVAGLVSRTQMHCRKTYIPDLFTRVSHYRKWIMRKISENN